MRWRRQPWCVVWRVERRLRSVMLRAAGGAYASAKVVGRGTWGGGAVVEVAPGDSSTIGSRGGGLRGLVQKVRAVYARWSW